MAHTHGGARVGAGRKSKAEEFGLYYLLVEAWPREERITFFRALAEKAQAGDMDAGKTLLHYTYGRPRECRADANEPHALDFEARY